VRPPHDRVLVVCEGSKTEPNYLEEIRRKLRISSADVRVVHSSLGTEPRQVVDSAEQMFLETKAYDAVYAVFDRDDHRTYEEALSRAAALDGLLKNDEGKRVPFKAVPSVPCFELWILLHFEDVHHFNHRDEVIAKVRHHIPGYAKGLSGVFELTEGQRAMAAERAARLRGRFTARSGEEPFTSFDELVAALLALKR
jgi:hypothetical protein